MNREDVEKLSTAAKGKINLLNSNFGKYFMRAIMAGFFIDVAMIYCNVVGNVFSCLAVLCGIKLKSESGKFLMIVICISGFVVSGFEHCIANMGIFTVAFCMVPGLSVGAMLKSMVIVTLGNIVGGAVLLAWPLRKMSADK